LKETTVAIASNPPAPAEAPATSRKTAYSEWIQSVGIPIHRGYYVEDVRTVEVAPWPGRNCSGAFLVLAGQEGVSEARVTEIPPGQSTTPLRFTIDDAVYVADGRGLTTVWAEGKEKKTFEWQKHSMFVIPRGYTHQLSNTQGNHPARLLHYNYLPISMEITPDPEFFFNNPYVNPNILYGQEQEFYSEAKSVMPGAGAGSLAGRILWYGSFFPDMRIWDKLHTYQERGAGGHRVWVEFARTGMTAHMSVFPSRTYKKGHRHGPGVVIIIPAGEGYSIMWPEGRDKVVIPWHEASVFVPPNRWFHQHFNVGDIPARYLAFHTPRALPRSETVEDLARDQIEYVAEDPSIRQRFESELDKRGLTSLMPDGAYTDPNYTWAYEEEE
jgi:oxalate decarboxylase/phosphoglucose isomerase-like protein (cupin superfamily)